MRVLLMGLFLCLFAALAARAETPVFRREPVTIVTASGESEFSAEIADTDASQQYGLMFRYTLAPDRAMLFDFGRVRKVGMWMKDTYIPLDMIFIRADGTVSSIAENTAPHSLDVIASEEPVLAVLEVAAGTARRLGLKPGDKVYHPIFKPAP
jgi:uncharacterized membrane protein (UPF0127 family)